MTFASKITPFMRKNNINNKEDKKYVKSQNGRKIIRIFNGEL